MFDESEPIYDEDDDDSGYKKPRYSHGHYKQGNKEGYTRYSSDNKYGGYDPTDYHKYTRKTMNKVHRDQHEGYHKQAKEMQSAYGNQRQYGRNSGYGSRRRGRGQRRNYGNNY